MPRQRYTDKSLYEQGRQFQTLQRPLTADSVTSVVGHNLLSLQHPDTLPSTVVRGDLILGNGTPKWGPLAVGAAYTHLESDGTDPAYQANLTLADDAYIGLPGPGGRLGFDLTPNPDQLKVTDADLNFVTAAHGIIHVDGVVVGQVLRADGTRYVPATLAIADISDLAYAAPGLTFTTANAAGAADSVMRTDASLAIFDIIVPDTIQPDDAAAVGVAAFAARRDHTHGIVAAAPGANLSVSSVNSEGVSTSFSRADHLHAITSSNAPGAARNLLATGLTGEVTLAGQLGLSGVGMFLSAGAVIDCDGIADVLILDADGDTTFSAPIDDRMDFEVGGTDRLVITNTDADFPVGYVRVNTPDANTFMTVGLEIDQKGDNDEVLAFRDSTSVAHGMTTLAETDTYAAFEKRVGSTGGLALSTYTEDNVAYRHLANFTNDTTGKTSTAGGAVTFLARKKSGTSIGNVAAGQNVFNIQSRSGGANRNIVIAAQDGDIYLDTVVNENAWDEHDDLALLHGLRASLVPDGHELQKRFGEWMAYARPVLEKTGVVTYNEDGHHFVATKKLQMLTIDALRQVAVQAFERIDTLEHRIGVLENGTQ